MANRTINITALPTRYEPLVRTFGERARTTFVPPADDLAAAKRFMAAAESSGQGKLLLVKAESGSGKSTFVHGLEVFIPDRVAGVVRLPQPHELEIAAIPGYLAKLPVSTKFTVVNFDGREAPYFSESEYQTFLGALNGVLRSRHDLLVFWPVTDGMFSSKIVGLLEKVGGRSAFGTAPVHELVGLRKEQYPVVLEKILQIANWSLEDAAVSSIEVDNLIGSADRLGSFLDQLQHLIAQRFDIGQMGIEFPHLVIAISSGDPKIRETCRSLRRADSFYIEASRLMMYTKRSNVAEWWANRATNLKSALPHVIALLNAQLVSLSASSVVHSILQFGDEELRAAVVGVRADRGNARRVISSSELYKFAIGEGVDTREYGSNVKDETFDSYDRIQHLSELKHKAINESILAMMNDSGVELPQLAYEKLLVPGLQTDAVYDSPAGRIALEFHYKQKDESSPNKIAIYVLEKLKEYAINYGLAER